MGPEGARQLWSFGGGPGSATSSSAREPPQVTLQLVDGVAVVTFVQTDGTYPWGTKQEEHRWNPPLLHALAAALDEVEKQGENVSALIVTNRGRFWSNGMDLRYMDAHDAGSVKENSAKANELMARICCFPLPTVAAFAGHWCAAGGMMGLAFDYRVMASDRGFFFIPGVDLGLVYAPMQMALMKAKLPQAMHREVILYNTKRWAGEELARRGVVDIAVPAAEVEEAALRLAASLKPKGQGPARRALKGIKRGLYREVLEAHKEGGDMGYDGRVKGVDRHAPPEAAPAAPAAKL